MSLSITWLFATIGAIAAGSAILGMFAGATSAAYVLKRFLQ